ncbi:serine hydrolase domain-containing protein [Legionella cardiaca]|uniref:Serine hydrolase n=1 Tax=Legionella cardiaca TaxID=1071983 RepID=A0ABY8ASJ8_9GAMM|nr:serine hydrolase domain-containing protein [Legionella cardiaca]WED42751.1 serine hydrolase [Legionella cardiaca]
MKIILSVFFTCFAAVAVATTSNNAINQILQQHLKKYGAEELFSGIQVSIKAKDKINTYTVGYRAHTPGSAPMDANTLFNIGSITKSFTAAIALLAESEGKIKLTDPLSNYLPDYPHWGELTLTSLFNMSTGIPNYSNTPTFNYLASKELRHYWSQDDLINLVYFKDYNPPRKAGFFYSNTGYVLMDKILTKAYEMPFQNLIVEKIIKPLNLKNTYYPIPDYPAPVLARLARGYSYNVYDNPELLGQDVTQNNLSWAGAAGAVVANSEDVIHWINDLFIENKLLSDAQKEKMQQLISLSSGLPLPITSAKDPLGFGLGISQGYDQKIGRYWFYKGETLGYRALYIYVPCNQVIISALLNSATNEENDHSRELVLSLYNHLLTKDEMLICGKNEIET